MNNFLEHQLPVSEWVEQFTDWLTSTFSGMFSFLQSIGQSLMDGITQIFLFIPPIIFILLITVVAFFISKRKLGLTSFTLVGLLFILNQGLWQDLMYTLTLVLISSLISIMVGIPLGILAAKNDKIQSIIKPILDFMQTMPGFVYLIPAVAFFGIGMVPGVFASVIFALPPTVRFTNLGIRQVPKELTEASDSFGGTSWQKLIKLELPLAKSTILAGINQTTMLSLSMVVIASMIGAPGLGRGVLSALQRAQVGNGFVNGVALVILAIIIDRFTQNLNRPKVAVTAYKSQRRRKIYWIIAGAISVFALLGGYFALNGQSKSAKTINLSYVEWDTEVASTNVIGEVLREMGYSVSLTPLDNAIMWESVASGETDGMVAAWLPTTHKAQYEKYKNRLDDLGENLKGGKVGIVVPSYMSADSISDLTNQANQTIVGIEPGAGMMSLAETTMESYDNLANWQLESSSTGAMTAALGQAISNHEEIVITGWSPHWMFSKYDLKYLEDSKGTMGSTETINTMVRKGLKEDQPEAYKVLDNFNWTVEDIESVMLAINNGESPESAAKKWIKENPEKVAEWKG